MRRGTKVIIGVGGNVGAGKTVVAQIFRDLGAEYVSADAIGWEVLPEISAILQEKFGSQIMNGMGVDKKKLRELVFSDPGKLMFLNRISHPILVKHILHRIEGIRSGIVVIDAALLFDWDDVYDVIDYPILVIADRDKKAMRARAKGIGKELFEKISAMQKDEEEMAKRARYVIKNNGTIDELREKCSKIYSEISNDC
jgi:dephospho-CoA kinase